MATNHPNAPLIYAWGLGFDGWDGDNDANLRAIGVLMQLGVISRAITAQPGSPANGDRYIIPTGATGAQWTGQAGKIGVFLDSAWRFFTANNGWIAYVAAEGIYCQFTASGWAVLTPGPSVKASSSEGATIGLNYVSYVTIANAGAQTVTNFTGTDNAGVKPGSRVVAKFLDGNTTLQHGATLVLAGAVNYNPPSGTRMELICTAFSGATPIFEECWRL